jgi:hypothetical protein
MELKDKLFDQVQLMKDLEDSKDTIVWLGHAGFRLSII